MAPPNLEESADHMENGPSETITVIEEENNSNGENVNGNKVPACLILST